MENKNFYFLEYINLVNNLIYKYLIIGLFTNLFLYYFPFLLPSIVFYFIIVVFFFKNLFRIINKNFFLLLVQIVVISLVSITFISFIIGYILNELILQRSLVNLMTDYFFCDLKTYFLANAYLCLFSVSILFFNRFLPRALFLEVLQKMNFLNLQTKQLNIFIVIVMCLIFEFFFFLRGIIGTQQTGFHIPQTIVGVKDYTSWYTALYFFVLSFHLLLNVLYLKNQENKFNFLSIIFLIFSVSINYILYSYYQRKLATAFFAVSFILYYLFTKKRMFSLRMIITYSCTLFIIFQAWIFLQAFRTGQMFKITESTTMKEAVIDKGAFWQFYSNPQLRGDVGALSLINISGRVYNNQSLASLFYYNSFNPNRYLYGQMLLTDVIISIPYIIYPQKVQRLKSKSSEDLMKSITDSPLYYKDTLETLQLYSYADFGIFGIIIYPIIINLLIFAIYLMIKNRFLTQVSAAFILTHFLPEITMSAGGTLLVTWFMFIRNMILFLFFFNLLTLFIEEKKILKE